jgi:hypothetical protein
MNTHAHKTPENKNQAVANTIARKENNTGLPDNLKSGIENLSGYSMDDVKVHYNSDKPTQLQALAYAQGTDIHVAPGQEQYLPHEAWHVAQQKQGRVKPTLQMKANVSINDDTQLEHEADVMGMKALAVTDQNAPLKTQSATSYIQRMSAVIQLGNDPIVSTEAIKFQYGLIHGSYVGTDNTADMHVSQKNASKPFSNLDVYRAFSFVYNKMVENKAKTGIEGQLTWNPQGAAVIKMVAELIGDSLGDPGLQDIAKSYKEARKANPTPEERDNYNISADIIPEHMQYLMAARGAEGITMKPVIASNNTEENYDTDMLKDTPEGIARFADYREALDAQEPIALRISVGQTQLGKMIDTMKGYAK